MEGGGENLGGGGDDPMDVDAPLPAVDPTGPEPHPHNNPQESSAPFRQSSHRTGPTASTATTRARPREMEGSNHVCPARSAVGAHTRDVVDLSREDGVLVAGGTGTMQPWSIGARQEQLSKRRALLASLKKVRGPPPATKPPFSGPRAHAGATCKLPSVASSTARSVSTTLHSHCQTSSSNNSSSSRQPSLARSNSNSSSNSARTRSTSTSQHDRDKNSGTAVTTLPETTATTTSSVAAADPGDPSFATSSQTQLDAQLALAIQLSLQEDDDPPPRGTSASSPPPPPSSSMGYESELPSATLRRMRAALLSAHRHRMPHRDSGREGDMNEAVMLEQLYFGGAPPGRSSHGSDVTSSFLQAQAEGLTDALGVSSVSEWRAYLLGCGGPVQPNETQNFGIDMSYEALTQLEDVKVGVPEEVLSMLPIFPYVKPEHQQQQDQDSCRCSICLSDFEAGELLTLVGCGHLFHHDCLFPWLKDHKHCPVCKADVTATVWEDPESL